MRQRFGNTNCGCQLSSFFLLYATPAKPGCRSDLGAYQKPSSTSSSDWTKCLVVYDHYLSLSAVRESALDRAVYLHRRVVHTSHTANSGTFYGSAATSATDDRYQRDLVLRSGIDLVLVSLFISASPLFTDVLVLVGSVAIDRRGGSEYGFAICFLDPLTGTWESDEFNHCAAKCNLLCRHPTNHPDPLISWSPSS